MCIHSVVQGRFDVIQADPPARTVPDAKILANTMSCSNDVGRISNLEHAIGSTRRDQKASNLHPSGFANPGERTAWTHQSSVSSRDLNALAEEYQKFLRTGRYGTEKKEG